MLQHIYKISPVQKQKKRPVHPVFIPFAGCERRCVFCAQDIQTGQQTKEMQEIYARTKTKLEAQVSESNNHQPFELAFYGGTFTALPLEWQNKWLQLAKEYKEIGLLSAFRCSTRPDKINTEILDRLNHFGMQTIELGVQSFDTNALMASERGYSGEQAKAACEQVKASGFNLVIQLMPGMPGSTVSVFEQDMKTSEAISPTAMRLYPCLVLKGTALARVWQKGGYLPWDTDTTIEALAKAAQRLWQLNIPVIRIGLAPEQGLEDNILAGPWHPALGNSITGKAFYLWIKNILDSLPNPLLHLNIPRNVQGAFWGQKGNLKPYYNALGITRNNIKFWDCSLVRFITTY